MEIKKIVHHDIMVNDDELSVIRNALCHYYTVTKNEGLNNSHTLCEQMLSVLGTIG